MADVEAYLSSFARSRDGGQRDDRHFGGMLDEIVIYDPALSATEVQGHYNAGIS